MARPASPSTPAADDSPIRILVAGAAALLIGGLLARDRRIARPSGALQSPD